MFSKAQLNSVQVRIPERYSSTRIRQLESDSIRQNHLCDAGVITYVACNSEQTLIPADVACGGVLEQEVEDGERERT